MVKIMVLGLYDYRVMGLGLGLGQLFSLKLLYWKPPERSSKRPPLGDP